MAWTRLGTRPIIRAMRSLTSTHRLQALSVPEITDEIERLVMRYGREVKFQGRKLRPGPLLNAIVLHFIRLPEAEQAHIIAGAVRELEALLADDDRAEGDRPTGPGLTASLDVTDRIEDEPEDEATPKRRRRSG
jgi:hypothetical protein